MGNAPAGIATESEWESMRGEQYRWNDLDGNRPTMQDYNKQEEE